MDDDKKGNIGGTILPREGLRLPGSHVIELKAAQMVFQGSRVKIYTVVSSVAPPSMQTAIMSAQPAFQKLAEPVLYACAHDDQPVGPRIGIKDVPETTLKALSVYHWDRRGRRRERFWWIVGGIGLAFLSAFATWLFT